MTAKQSSEIPTCSKHNVPLEDDDCNRCGGNGYTEEDLEEQDDPLLCGNGTCYRCNGSGILIAWNCPECEFEHDVLEDE